MRLYLHDRIILGYLAEHPDFSYNRLSKLLNCSKVMIDERLQLLIENEYVLVTRDGVLLTKEGKNEKIDFVQPTEPKKREEFIWDMLYIPENFTLAD